MNLNKTWEPNESDPIVRVTPLFVTPLFALIKNEPPPENFNYVQGTLW